MLACDSDKTPQLTGVLKALRVLHRPFYVDHFLQNTSTVGLGRAMLKGMGVSLTTTLEYPQKPEKKEMLSEFGDPLLLAICILY